MNASPKRPNILVMVSHDTGNRLSCYGGPVETPNLDTIGNKGAKFTNNFATAPQCSPSRGSILTGKMPHVNGLIGLSNRGWNLPTSNKTIPKMLSEAGYVTQLIGLQHVHEDRTTIGYQKTNNPVFEAPFFACQVKNRAIKFFKKVEAGKIKQPFYCKLGFFETHRPFLTGRRKRTRPQDVVLPDYLPDTLEVRKEIGRFDGMLRELDFRVGQILRALRETTFAENTIVIYTVDHGWPFPRAKGTLFDAGIKTALLMHWPGYIEGGRVYSDLISNVDLLPTIMEIVGNPLSNKKISELQGQSFKSLILPGKNSYQPRNHIFAELTYHDQGYNPIRCIRTKKWKFIKNFEKFGDQLFMIPVDFKDKASGKDYRANHPEYNSIRPDEELYDLENDPGEWNNLAMDQDYKEVVSNLREQLMDFLKNTNDPVLDGSVPPMRGKGPIIM